MGANADANVRMTILGEKNQIEYYEGYKKTRIVLDNGLLSSLAIGIINHLLFDIQLVLLLGSLLLLSNLLANILYMLLLLLSLLLLMKLGYLLCL